MGSKDLQTTSLRPAPTVQTRAFDGELVILDMAGGEYYALDATGSLLWRSLAAGRTVADAAREIVAKHDVTFERALGDLEELARDLVARGLLLAG